MGPLSTLFVANVDAAHRAAFTSAPDLEAELARALATAAEAWPELAQSAEQFVPYLAVRVPAPSDGGVLVGIHITDLYVACACASSHPKAIATFDARFLPEIAIAVRSMAAGRSLLDDVQQILRVELFVAAPDRPALITTFKGRGSLRGWLRSVAVRTAIKLLHKARHELALGDDHLLDVPASDAGPELAHFRRHYGVEFRAAFASALDTLDSRERNLLRQHFLDQLNIDELGVLYGAHRATIARWIARARMTMLERTRERLRERIGLAGPELESVLRLVRSELYTSLRRMLEPP